MKKTFGVISRVFQRLATTSAVVKLIVVFMALIAVGTYGAWEYHNITNPDKVFWGAVETNLRTTSLARRSVQTDRGQTTDQRTEITTSPRQLLHAVADINEQGPPSAKVITENIATPTTDYVRYTNIATSQKTESGDKLDFSEIINVWSKGQDEDSTKTTGQLYNQSVLGAIPVGNLSASQREQIISTMKSKGAYSYKLKQKTSNGLLHRPVYTYELSVKPEGYITTLKMYAQSVGLNQLEDVDPSKYKSAPAIKFIVTVDGWSHQITKLTQVETNKMEVIGARNSRKTLPNPPLQTITVDELQSRLDSL